MQNIYFTEREIWAVVELYDDVVQNVYNFFSRKDAINWILNDHISTDGVETDTRFIIADLERDNAFVTRHYAYVLTPVSKSSKVPDRVQKHRYKLEIVAKSLEDREEQDDFFQDLGIELESDRDTNEIIFKFNGVIHIWKKY